jgi:two-component sensor histidine kinase
LFSVFLTTNKEPLSGPVNKVTMDTVTNASVVIDDLERQMVRVEENKYSEWAEVKSFPLLNLDTANPRYPRAPENLPLTKGDYYAVFQFYVIPYTTRVISIRNKKTKEELINFRLRILNRPTLPFLNLLAKNKADEKLIDSFLLHTLPFKRPERKVVSGRSEPIIIPAPPAPPEVPIVLNNEDLDKTSRLVLYFKMLSDYYPDSSLQYRLSTETNKDTAWIKTGHRLVIPQLNAGAHYKLEIRYELHPGHIQQHTFYTAPKWYKTTLTKTIVAGTLVAGALLAWLLVYRQRLQKSRRRKEQLSLEIKSIRSQLNPHFIFNALASIQGLINKNDVPAANHYLTEFSTLLRESLHNSEKEMVPLVMEVKLLETYLKLEQLRFNFKYAIQIDEAINKNTTEIPNLVLQPLVENAVKHGVSTLGEKGFIKIDFIKRGNDMLVSIIDNGNKFDGTQTSTGFGLRLTRSRISLLSQTLKEQPVKLNIERKDDRETIVNLVFTNWL